MKNRYIELLRSALAFLNLEGLFYTWLVCISITIFNGVLLYAITLRGFALSDMLRAILIDILIALPVLIIGKKRYIFYTMFVSAVLLLFGILNAFHIFTYQSSISTYAIFSLLETTSQESAEFMKDQMGFGKMIMSLLVLAVPAWLVARLFRSKTILSPKVFVPGGLLLLIAAIPVSSGALEQGYRFLSSHSGYLTAWSLEKYYEEHSKVQREQIVPDDVFGAIESPVKPETCIIVVGESANRNHMGIYGYARNTTPHVRDNGWIVFNDVISPATHTVPSLKRVLRFQDIEKDGYRPSIVDLFNLAGFKTFWLSNQTAPKGSGNILERLTAHASRQCYINLSRKEGKSCTYDGELVPFLEKALQDTAPRKAVFLHLLGSHLTYALRYPSGMSMFDAEDAEGLTLKDWQDDEALEHINHYDNSIVYTDHVLDEIRKAANQAGGSSYILYFSDHGQDVYDSRNMRGCSERSPSKHMIEVPMMVWCSPEYRAQHPTMVDTLEQLRGKPYSTGTLSATIASISGIESPQLHTSQSLFSEVVEKDRTVHGKLYREMPK